MAGKVQNMKVLILNKQRSNPDGYREEVWYSKMPNIFMLPPLVRILKDN